MQLSGVAAVLAILVSACATTSVSQDRVSVKTLIENQTKFEGKKLLVVGYLPSCQPLGCPLTQGPDAVGRKYRLGIGTGIDSELKQYVGHRIVIEAVFTGNCVSNPASDEIAACTDRATSLEKPRFVGLATSESNAKAD